MNSKLKHFLALHVLLLLYSFSSLISKTAAGVEFLSLEFCLLYAGLIALLGIYALGWQQILKRMDLTTAFSNKAVIVVWGIIWGALFFAEPITLPKIVGAAMIIVGVALFSQADIEAASQAVVDAARPARGNSRAGGSSTGDHVGACNGGDPRE